MDTTQTASKKFRNIMSVKQAGSRSDVLNALNWVHILFAIWDISIDDRKFESTSYRVGIA